MACPADSGRVDRVADSDCVVLGAIMRVACIIQARLGSARLPRKILADLHGKPLLAHVIERAQAIKGVTQVIVAVPMPDYAEISEAVGEGVAICAPNTDGADVLGRYLAVAESVHADVIMRVTGDCPLLDNHLAEQVLNLYQKLADPYIIAVNDTNLSGLPDGTDVEVFSMQALQAASACTRDPFCREHVTTWLREELPNYGILAPRGQAITGAKWSVDSLEDLARVRTIMSQLEAGQFGWRETAKAWRRMT